MVGFNGNKWLDHQVEMLTDMVDNAKAAGKRPNYRDIAAAVGHPISSCQQIMCRVRMARVRALARAESSAAAQSEQDPRSALPEVQRRATRPDAPFLRGTSTHILMADRELRARIEICGLTGGLFGDPVPGRSALDQKRNGP